jgi:uncharacterized protein YndB with AHSA1/START domain
MTQHSVAYETFVIERTYDAPVDQVFRAWADPELKTRWFAGSADALGDTYKLDFRVGGHEINSGGPPGGPHYTYDSDYREIIPEQRIIYTYEMHADENLISVTVATIEFKGAGATTHLLLTEQGVFLDGHDNVAQREAGTRSFLESLATMLENHGS